MSSRPEIIISATDADRLDKLLASLPRGQFPGRAALEAELARATIVEPKDVPPTVVTMNSTVKFSADASGDDFELTLVYPKDVDSSGKTISILAPVGSALLGLAVGQTIEWPSTNGRTLHLRVLAVTPPAA